MYKVYLYTNDGIHCGYCFGSVVRANNIVGRVMFSVVFWTTNDKLSQWKTSGVNLKVIILLVIIIYY